MVLTQVVGVVTGSFYIIGILFGTPLIYSCPAILLMPLS